MTVIGSWFVRPSKCKKTVWASYPPLGKQYQTCRNPGIWSSSYSDDCRIFEKLQTRKTSQNWVIELGKKNYIPSAHLWLVICHFSFTCIFCVAPFPAFSSTSTTTPGRLEPDTDDSLLAAMDSRHHSVLSALSTLVVTEFFRSPVTSAGRQGLPRFIQLNKNGLKGTTRITQARCSLDGLFEMLTWEGTFHLQPTMPRCQSHANDGTSRRSRHASRDVFFYITSLAMALWLQLKLNWSWVFSNPWSDSNWFLPFLNSRDSFDFLPPLAHRRRII